MIDDESIRKLRNQVDLVDTELIKLLAKRRDLTIEIGKIKKRKNIPIMDGERRGEVLDRIRKEAKKHGLDEKKAEDFWGCIIDCAIKEQEKLVFTND